MEQVQLNFDSTGFENVPTLHDYIVRCSFTLKDKYGNPVYQNTQAMNMDLSPSQWNQKLNKTNNTSISVCDLERYTEQHNDTRWIDFAYWKFRIQGGADIDDLKRMRDELEQQIAARES